jgi:ribonucleoside-diphosphate reductase alpha chain
MMKNTNLFDNPQPISLFAWDDKYRLKNPDGTSTENSPQDSHRRVVEGVFAKDPDKKKKNAAFDAMVRGDLMPAGRIHAGAGTGRRVTLINCFVSPEIEDSLESEKGVGIADALKVAMVTQQYGGGIGMDYSSIRPNLALVKRTGSISSGVLPFMDMWHAMCSTIRSAGSRRGAMMGTLAIWHPDILEFITAKQTKGRLTNFNVSCLVTDDFMEALEKDLDWDLKFPVPRADGNHVAVLEKEGQPTWYVYHRMKAKELWEFITLNTYTYSEPGIIFIDRINNQNNLWYCEKIHCTNPCGEQPLPPNGDCNLGHLNLATHVKNPFTDKAEVDWPRLKEATHLAVRFLDNVLDVSMFPTPAQKEEAESKRRIGLGYAGLANFLQQLRLPYGSKEARKAANEVAKFIAIEAYRASVALAKERGPFPLFDANKISAAHFINKLPEDLQAEIQKTGLRNGVLLSIAPTGTTSLYYGNIDGGLEPTFDWVYDRNVRKPGSAKEEYVLYKDVMAYGFKQFTAHLYPDATDFKVKGRELSYKEGGETKTATLPDYMVSALELSVESHVLMQAAVQEWVDASISKTVNCPEEMTVEEFRNVYKLAWDNGLKGCTTYRPSDIRGSILVKKEEPKQAKEKPPARPSELEGKTYKLRWPTVDYAFYITINDKDEDGKKTPFEIFVNTKSLQHQEWIAALTRMISAIFRKGGDIEFVVEELEQVHSPTGGFWLEGKYVPSLVALIGRTIKHHIGKEEPRPQEVQLEHQHAKGETCPKCNAPTLVRKEGCKSCTNCGFSECG